MCLKTTECLKPVSKNQKQERLIWTDKSTELQITAGYETARIYSLGKPNQEYCPTSYIYHLQAFVLHSRKQ